MSNKINIAGKEINPRLTKRNLKLAKERYGLDLSVVDMSKPLNSEAMRVITDPIFMAECFWKFHEDQLVELGFSEDSFSDAIGEDEIEVMRETTIKSCAAFFPFLKTFSTMMRVALPGNPDSAMSLDQMKEAIQKAAQGAVSATPTQ